MSIPVDPKLGGPAEPTKALAADSAKAEGLEGKLRGRAWWIRTSMTSEPPRVLPKCAAPCPLEPGVKGQGGEGESPKEASRTRSSAASGPPEVLSMYVVLCPPRLGAERQGGEARGTGAKGPLPEPTWIEDDLVDSQAMFSAFLHYLGQCSEEERKVMKGRVPHIPCVEHDCERCDQKIGGYKFKRYAHQWLEDYLGLMRPGSWVPPVLRICPDPRGTGEFLWEGGGILSDSSDSN